MRRDENKDIVILLAGDLKNAMHVMHKHMKLGQTEPNKNGAIIRRGAWILISILDLGGEEEWRKSIMLDREIVTLGDNHNLEKGIKNLGGKIIAMDEWIALRNGMEVNQYKRWLGKI